MSMGTGIAPVKAQARRMFVTSCFRADHVTSFEEKKPDAGPGWINAGVYLLKRSLVAAMPEDRFVSLEKDGLPNWLDAPLGVHLSDGRFLDIGLPESYAETEAFFADHRRAQAA